MSEDELLLAEMEGAEAARATAAYGRARRRKVGLERSAQLERICEIFGFGQRREDPRSWALDGVLGYVDEGAWRRTLDQLRNDLIEEPDLEAYPQLDPEMNWLPPELWEFAHERVGAGGTIHRERLFLTDREATASMTLTRAEAVKRAESYLGSSPAFEVDPQWVCPNPLLDLWLVGYRDRARPDEVLLGGGPMVVPVEGEVYTTSASPLGPSHAPPELVGAITPVEY